VWGSLKRVVVGVPIATSEEHHQRLTKKIALAVFASDAISSTAYATQEILLVLVPVAGMAALNDIVPLALVVCVLLAIVVTSYRQTIKAYPQGGGSYVVSRENLGRMPSLVAGASILVDYVLTVAVSVSAGVAAIDSAFPELRSSRVVLCLGFIVLMTLANLRGLKESGRLFAGPTYIYVVALGGLILIGLARSYFGDLGPLPVNQDALDEITHNGALLTGTTALIMLRAFSSGAVALTGVEAIADGVPAFRKPESKNAATTLTWMAIILGTAFFGLAVLTHRLRPTVSENETLLSILGKAVYGSGSFMYYVLQFSTFAILILAANTAFADFPRLSSIISRDGFLPRQMANRGDRLVFSNGIVFLAGLASVLIVAFDGDTAALIPLYAVGVFTSFTLSQFGMFRFQRSHRHVGWQRRSVISLVGSIATFIVLLVVVVSKFTKGAWIPAVVIPMIVLLFVQIGRHYSSVREAIYVPPGWRAKRHTHNVVVLVGGVNRGVLQALTYARSLAPDRLIAVSVVSDELEQERITKQWAEYEIPIELHVLLSAYRELTRPILRYLDEIDSESPDDMITVVIPEVVVTHWFTNVLHNQSALALKARLLYRPNTVVTSVPVIVG
jgi:amino acid transporter